MFRIVVCIAGMSASCSWSSCTMSVDGCGWSFCPGLCFAFLSFALFLTKQSNQPTKQQPAHAPTNQHVHSWKSCGLLVKLLSCVAYGCGFNSAKFGTVDGLVDWLVGGLVPWVLIGWLIDLCFIGLSISRFIDCLAAVSRLVAWLVCLLTCCLIG